VSDGRRAPLMARSAFEGGASPSRDFGGVFRTTGAASGVRSAPVVERCRCCICARNSARIQHPSAEPRSNFMPLSNSLNYRGAFYFFVGSFGVDLGRLQALTGTFAGTFPKGAIGTASIEWASGADLKPKNSATARPSRPPSIMPGSAKTTSAGRQLPWPKPTTTRNGILTLLRVLEAISFREQGTSLRFHSLRNRRRSQQWYPRLRLQTSRLTFHEKK
jgi:hypothetical protein